MYLHLQIKNQISTKEKIQMIVEMFDSKNSTQDGTYQSCKVIY